jgi:rhodanese-related sulfurtransferase
MTAANYLEAQGFDVVSVAGGTGAWIGSGKEVSMEASN